MKTAATLLVASLLILGSSSATAADVTTWELPEINLTLSLPADLAVATREGIQTHPESFESVEWDGPDLLSALEERDAYLVGLGPDVDYLVGSMDAPVNLDRYWNLTTVPEDLIRELAIDTAQAMEVNGYQADFEEVHRVGELTYFVIVGSDTASATHFRQYYTIVNGRPTSLSLYSYSGPVSDADATDQRRAVDSIRFLSIEPDPAPVLDPSLDAINRTESLGRLLRAVGVALALAIPIVVVVLVRRHRRKGGA